MNSSAYVLVILSEGCRFIRDFFDRHKPSANTALAMLTASSPRSREKADPFISGELVIEIIKDLRNKFILHKPPTPNAKRAELERLMRDYFSHTLNGSPRLNDFQNFLNLLLKCEAEYRAKHDNNKELWGNDTALILQMVQELKVLIEKEWEFQKFSVGLVDKVSLEVRNERNCQKKYVLQKEMGAEQRIYNYLDLVDSRLQIIMTHEIKPLQKKDYESYQKLIKKRETLPNFIDGQILGLAGLIGGPVLSAIATKAGSVLNGAVNAAVSLAGENFNERFKNYGKKKFNAIEKWNLDILENKMDSQNIHSKEFIRNRLDLLRDVFIDGLYEQENMRQLVAGERASLFEQKTLENIILSESDFLAELKLRVNNKIDQCIDEYLSIIREFAEQHGMPKEGQGLSETDLIYLKIFSLSELYVPWGHEDGNPLDRLKKEGVLEGILSQTIPAGESVRGYVHQLPWIKNYKSEQRNKLLAITGLIEQEKQGLVSNYLGIEPENIKNMSERSQYTFLAIGLIRLAFQRHCQTFLPHVNQDSHSIFNAIHEILELAAHPVFKRKKPNILLNVFLSLPGMLGFIMEDRVRVRLCEYLRPAVAAHIQIPPEILLMIWKGEREAEERETFFKEQQRWSYFFDDFFDKNNMWFSGVEKNRISENNKQKKPLVEFLKKMPSELAQFKPSSFFLINENGQKWRLSYLNKRKVISSLSKEVIKGLPPLLADKNEADLSKEDKEEIKTLISNYYNQVIVEREKKTVSELELKKVKVDVESIVIGPIKTAEELQLTKLLIPYRHILRKLLPLSLDLIKEDANYVKKLEIFIDYIKGANLYLIPREELESCSKDCSKTGEHAVVLVGEGKQVQAYFYKYGQLIENPSQFKLKKQDRALLRRNSQGLVKLNEQNEARIDQILRSLWLQGGPKWVRRNKSLALLVNPHLYTLAEAQEEMARTLCDLLLQQPKPMKCMPANMDSYRFGLKKALINAIVREEYQAQRKLINIKTFEMGKLSIKSFGMFAEDSILLTKNCSPKPEEPELVQKIKDLLHSESNLQKTPVRPVLGADTESMEIKSSFFLQKKKLPPISPLLLASTRSISIVPPESQGSLSLPNIPIESGNKPCRVKIIKTPQLPSIWSESERKTYPLGNQSPLAFKSPLPGAL